MTVRKLGVLSTYDTELYLLPQAHQHTTHAGRRFSGVSFDTVILHLHKTRETQRAEFNSPGGFQKLCYNRSMKKCYNCRKEHENKDIIFCDECKEKQDKGDLDTKGSSTYVIYDKI